jgi:dihydrodipicolinate synthase/N-acetylneuraminate lyase
MLIDGIHVPLTSPFYRDGRLYLRKLEHNVARYSLTPVAGLVAFASESTALTDEEIRESLHSIAEFAAKEKVLIAAIAKDSVAAALIVAEQAAAANFDALLLSAPKLSTSYATDLETRLLFFRAVADAADLPVLVRGDSSLPVEAVAELAAHPNIIGLYDAELTVERFHAIAAATKQIQREVTVTTTFAPVTRRMLIPEAGEGAANFVTAESLTGGAAVAVAPPKPAIKTRTKTVGFQVMRLGSAMNIVSLLEIGVAGAMPALAASAPQGVYEAFAAFKDGDPALAAEKQNRLAAADALMEKLGIAGIKYGCDWNGYYGGAPRLPLVPLTSADKLAVEKVLAGLRN